MRNIGKGKRSIPIGFNGGTRQRLIGNRFGSPTEGGSVELRADGDRSAFVAHHRIAYRLTTGRQCNLKCIHQLEKRRCGGQRVKDFLWNGQGCQGKREAVNP